MVSISHWGMFTASNSGDYVMPMGDAFADLKRAYKSMTNRQKLVLHQSLGLIDERFS